tara:strand:- start:555 stop:1715 length:1161 start_codon:yes stop_codon:yes gene_type:complete
MKINLLQNSKPNTNIRPGLRKKADAKELKRIKNQFSIMGRERFEKYQKGNSLQQQSTPFELVLEMLERLGSLKGKGILVVANVDIFFQLKELKKHNFIDYKSIKLLTDIELLKGKDNVEVADFDKIPYINLKMKFDIVIANPPYNDSTSTTEDKPQKQKKAFTGKLFLEWLPTIATEAAILCPTKGYWQGTHRSSTVKRLSKLGIRKVAAVEEFKELVTLDGIAAYYFTEGYTGEIQDDYKVTIEIPEKNLGQELIYGSSELISGVVQKTPLPPGESNFYITPVRTVWKNVDVSTIEDPSKGTYRVILPQNGTSQEKYGVPRLINPEDALSYSVVYFPVRDKLTGQLLIEYLNRSDIRALAAEFRVSSTNSQHNFSCIPTPDFMKP